MKPLNPSMNIYRSSGEMQTAAAKEIMQIMASAVLMKGVCHLGLSGGETPRGVYRLLGSQPLRDEIDWRKVHMFFSDERMVPPTDAMSNYRMVEHELVSAVDLPVANVHRVKCRR
jgi:6-phosphogluconolactonase